MTGIERLRQMAEDFKNVKTAEHCTFIVNTWRGRYIDDAIADIADQIEREQGEDADAIAWVRKHGGIESVKAKQRESMLRAAYERKKAGFLGHIAECETALRRRNQRIEELGHRVSDLTRENAELRKRAMPEGMCWPVFEDREPVRIGDEFECWCGETHTVGSVTIREGRSTLNESQPHSFVVSDGPFTAHGKRVKRPAPKVYDADRAEIREGDTVWNSVGTAFTVCAVNGDKSSFDAVRGYDGQKCPGLNPAIFTHRAPVIAADGRPLHEGEHVYHVETGAELVVKELPKPGEYQAVVVFALPTSPASHLTSFDPDRLTHERPDSWERLEEDAGMQPHAYCVGHMLYGGEDEESTTPTNELFARDLVRRAKRLAERGQ